MRIDAAATQPVFGGLRHQLIPFAGCVIKRPILDTAGRDRLCGYGAAGSHAASTSRDSRSFCFAQSVRPTLRRDGLRVSKCLFGIWRREVRSPVDVFSVHGDILGKASAICRASSARRSSSPRTWKLRHGPPRRTALPAHKGKCNHSPSSPTQASPRLLSFGRAAELKEPAQWLTSYPQRRCPVDAVPGSVYSCGV